MLPFCSKTTRKEEKIVHKKIGHKMLCMHCPVLPSNLKNKASQKKWFKEKKIETQEHSICLGTRLYALTKIVDELMQNLKKKPKTKKSEREREADKNMTHT